MRIRLIAGLGFGALGIVVTACSSSSSGNSNPYPDVATFCQAVAKAECQEATNCGVDETQCETYRASQCQQGTIIVKQTPTDTLSRTYTSGNAKGCLDALNGAFGGGNVQIKYADLQKLLDSCEAVFVGNAGNGSGCVTKYDCTKSGEICAPLPGRTDQGACATSTPKMTGDVCADPGDTCPDSNYCSTASGTPTCVASSTTGGPCQSNLQCVTSDHCVNGACAARAESGGACSTDADCDPMTAPFCDPDVNKCAVGLGFLNGSFDCNGFLLGQNLPDGGPTVNDSGGGGNDGGTMEAATDAPSGG
ncbi:MAG TPA: dickkopf-related protein [Polyangiaceae bacterium]|nr:dickkopf-related protein [Polyangiaceae bacterium]